MENLSLIPIDDLIDEIKRRFPHFLMIGIKPEGANDTRLWWRVVGLDIECEGLYKKLGDKVEQSFEDEDNDDD